MPLFINTEPHINGPKGYSPVKKGSSTKNFEILKKKYTCIDRLFFILILYILAFTLWPGVIVVFEVKINLNYKGLQTHRWTNRSKQGKGSTINNQRGQSKSQKFMVSLVLRKDSAMIYFFAEEGISIFSRSSPDH